MPRRLDKTLADYLVIAITPALIMTLVGSLVFFLVEVFYQGQYEWRLRFVLGAFVLAAVLIGRISIEFGAERAAMYAMPLALVTGLAIHRLVGEQGGTLGSLGLGFNLGLLGLIWWAAHKLVWDCTMIDETQDSSGEGLLQVAGLDRGKGPEPTQATESPAATPEPEGVAPREAAFTPPRPWWLGSSRPHAPGVWIVYFSLAALPIFGLGQTMLPASNVEARRHAFQLLVVYVASALGLLLTTSFLGLRRYLRQRQLQMPLPMAGLWVGIGAVMIALLLGFAMLLPRPSAEYTLADLPIRFGSKDHTSSRYAIGRDGTKEQQPEAAKVTQPNQDAPKTGQAKPEAGKAPGKDGPPAGDGKPSAAQKEPGGKAAQASGGSPEKGPSKPDASGPRERSQPREGQPSTKTGEAKTGEPGRSQEATDKKPASEPSKPSFQSPSLLQQASQWLPVLLKWAFYGFLAFLLAFWIIRNWASLVAETRRLLQELRELWGRLFGKVRQRGEIVEAEVVPEGPAARHLADYPDPFLTGAAGRLTPDALVRYSFEALEAWARDRGCPRPPEQTPLEFADQVAQHEAGLARDARALTHLYCRVAYAPGTLPSNQEPLRRFWQRLAEVEHRTMLSAPTQQAP